jgi:succinate dehydrogenase / fumarate reductase flavoprotein subunit
VAGEAACDAAASGPHAPLPEGEVSAERDRVFSFLNADADGPRPVRAKNRIREIMWDLGFVKSEEKMSRALDRLREVRAEIVPRMRLQSASRAWNTGWMDALDVHSMLDACEATLRSGMLRKESRGPFYRKDYPYVDNENWLCKMIVSREGGQWSSRTEAYELTRLKPENLREHYFDADY